MEIFVNYFSVFCMFLLGIIFPLVEKINTAEEGRETWLTKHLSEDMCGIIVAILTFILFSCFMFLTYSDIIKCSGNLVDIISTIICNLILFLLACLFIISIPPGLVSLINEGPQTKEDFRLLFFYLACVGYCLGHIYNCITTSQSFKIIEIGCFTLIGLLLSLLISAIYEGILWIYKKIKK